MSEATLTETEDALADKLAAQIKALGPVAPLARSVVFDTLRQVCVRLDLLTQLLEDPRKVTPILETMLDALRWSNQSAIDMQQSAGATRQ